MVPAKWTIAVSTEITWSRFSTAAVVSTKSSSSESSASIARPSGGRSVWAAVSSFYRARYRTPGAPLRRREDHPWEIALDRIADEDRAYATALLSRGINIFEKPKIKLSTIHGAKGGEADNVLLFLDLSWKALKEMEKNPDDAHRVLYVGMTRAKQNLILKMPEDSQRGWAI